MKLYFTLQELNPNNFPMTPEIEENLNQLIIKMSVLREVYGKPLPVTSGLRSIQKQIDIYKAKGITDPAKIPMGSAHLSGQAVDILDSFKELQAFCLQNENLLEYLGLYCESFSATPNWCHFQTRKPASGKRFFNP